MTECYVCRKKTSDGPYNVEYGYYKVRLPDGRVMEDVWIHDDCAKWVVSKWVAKEEHTRKLRKAALECAQQGDDMGEDE